MIVRKSAKTMAMADRSIKTSKSTKPRTDLVAPLIHADSESGYIAPKSAGAAIMTTDNSVNGNINHNQRLVGKILQPNAITTIGEMTRINPNQGTQNKYDPTASKRGMMITTVGLQCCAVTSSIPCRFSYLRLLPLHSKRPDAAASRVRSKPHHRGRRNHAHERQREF